LRTSAGSKREDSAKEQRRAQSGGVHEGESTLGGIAMAADSKAFSEAGCPAAIALPHTQEAICIILIIKELRQKEFVRP
jgi:hypothetical protein